MKIIFEKAHPDAQLPKQATERDFGFDIKSIEDYTLQPGEVKAIDTGLLWEPQLNWIEKRKYVYELEVRPRSGLAAKNYIGVLNAPGTIDEGYRNKIGVILVNHGKLPFEIKKGDRIAQVFPQRRPICKMKEGVVDKGFNRGGGLGSTGIK